MLALDTTCHTCGAPLPPSDSVVDGRCGACLFGAALDAEEDGALGGIDGFALLAEIARGGMGVVYRAQQHEPERLVALKTMRGGVLDTPGAIERFRREAAAMAELEHPAILPVYQAGEHDGFPYFTMKLATGGTLAERLDRFAGKWHAIAQLIATVADAVQHAHARGVLHRDLKPANILFDESGRPYVSDFGLAKVADATATALTLTAAALGTPHYLAPEVAAHDARAATIASDGWSLGVILYELLAQRRPFAGEGIPALLRAITEEEPAPLPGVPRDLAIIAGKALAKDPARRYATAAALAEDLRRWLAGQPITARPVGLVEKAWLWARRHPAVAALAGLLAISVASVVFTLANARQATLARLRGSLLAQAHAARTSTEKGQRAVALDALRQAAQLAPGADVRDEFISALALPDYAERARIPWAGEVAPALTGDLQTSARVEAGGISIRGSDGQVRARVPALAEPIASLGPFSADGTRLLVETEKTARLWNLTAGAWHEWTPGVTVLPRGAEDHFSPDGKWLARNATFTGEGPIEVYPLDPPGPPRTWPNPWKRSKVSGFSPDGRLLAVRAYGRPEVIVLDPQSGDVRHRLRLPASANVRCAAWRRDGQALAVGTENFKIYLWRLVESPMPVQLLGHTGNLTALDWNPDGTHLLSAAMDGTTRLWEVRTGATLAVWPWPGTRVRCSSDGAEFAADDEAGRVTIISRLRAPEFCRELPLAHPDLDERGTAGSWCVEFSPDGRRVLAGDTLGVFVFDAATGALVARHATDYCWALAFGEDGGFFAGTRGGVLGWSAPGAEGDGARLHEGDSGMLAAVRDWIAIGVENELRLFRKGQHVATKSSPHRLDRVALHPAGRFAAAGHRKEPGVSVWALDSETARELPTTGPEASVAWTADGRRLLIGDAWGVRAFATDTLDESWRVPGKPRQQTPSLLAVAARSGLAAATLQDGIVTLLDAKTGAVLARLEHPQPRDIRHLALAPDGSRLAAMNLGHLVHLWDLSAVRRELSATGLDWE